MPIKKNRVQMKFYLLINQHYRKYNEKKLASKGSFGDFKRTLRVFRNK